MHSKQIETHFNPISGNQPRLNKIAMLGSYPPLRGISSYCFGLSQAMAHLVPVEFVSFKRMYPKLLYPGGDLSDDHTFPGDTNGNLCIRRRLCWHNPLSWISESVRMQADLLHAQWWSMPLAPIYACLAAGFKVRGKPVVFTIHNVLGHESSAIFFNASKLLFKLGDHFIIHSDNNRRQLEALYGIAPDRTSLIPHGSLDFQVRKNVDRDGIRAGFGYTKKDKVILLFGAIRPYKGADTAMRAFAKVVERMPEAKLLIAGLPWEKWGRYRRLMERLQIASAVQTDLQYIPAGKVHRYFEAADLVLLPYHHFDSQSGVGSSAVAFRKPMIVSAVGGLPELVKDSRWVVPPGDPDALAAAVLACLNDTGVLDEMAAATAAVANELDWTAIAKKTLAVYGRLARNNPERIGMV